MLYIISPAKALNFVSIAKQDPSTPVFLERADRLAQKLKKKSPRSLKKLFHVSQDLAELNYDRFQNWDAAKSEEFGKKALNAFNGHVYQKIDVATLSHNLHRQLPLGVFGLELTV